MSVYHYRDIVSVDGAVNLRALMSIAVSAARSEREKCLKAGWSRSWRDVLGAALRLIWSGVKVARACAQARAEFDALAPQERLARHFELKAELAESAIPSRDEEARNFRMSAQETRALAA